MATAKSKKKKKRLDSKLESAGAEFLVLGMMLVEGIECHKTYTNNPAFDLVAVNALRNTSARIQVKSRYATDFDGGFLISKFDNDFVVLAKLNRGFHYSKKHKAKEAANGGKLAPELFVIPTKVVKDARYKKSSWGKTYLKSIPNYEMYREKWQLIREFLNAAEPRKHALL